MVLRIYIHTSFPEVLQDAQTGSQPSHFDFLTMDIQCWQQWSVQQSQYGVPPPTVVAGTTSIATTLHQGLGWRMRSGEAFVIERDKQTVYILEADIEERVKGRHHDERLGSQKARLFERPKSAHHPRSNKVCPGLWRLPHPPMATDSKLRRQQCHY